MQDTARLESIQDAVTEKSEALFATEGKLTSLARERLNSRGEIRKLNDKIGYYSRRVSSLTNSMDRLRPRSILRKKV